MGLRKDSDGDYDGCGSGRHANRSGKMGSAHKSQSGRGPRTGKGGRSYEQVKGAK